jgi:hypothetical protein
MIRTRLVYENEKYMLVTMFMFNTHVIYCVNHYDISIVDT